MSAITMKRISQETFDEVVNENIEDLDMEPKEALADAITQFKSQGVDLKNIDITGGVGRAEMEAALASLKTFVTSNEVFDAKTNSTIIQYDSKQKNDVINNLNTFCDPKCEQHIRNREMMNPNGLNNLLELLIPDQENELLINTMKLVSLLSKYSLELRDFIEPGGSARISKIIDGRLKLLQSNENEDDNILVIRFACALARSVSKSENNKNMLSRTGTMDSIATIITLYSKIATTIDDDGNDNKYAALVSDACVVMRSLCVHDDMRREMSCAMDNGKFFLSTNGIVSSLMAASSSFKKSPGLAGQALAAAKTLVTTEDAVKTMALHGAMTLPAEILAFPNAETQLIRNCLGLMRNLCADDLRKDKLVDDGSMRLTVAAMSKEENFVDGTLMEHGAACLAAMSLRSPTNSYRIAETGAIDILVKGMRRHPSHGAYQRQCSLCIRNISARCTDLRQNILDTGAEEVLRSAGRIQEAVDEAYAALRDLGCEVHKVKISADGKVEAAYEQFGEKKSAFKAVWDDDPSENQPGLSNIEEAVQREAHAPFEGGTGQGASRPAMKANPFADEEIEHYGDDDDILGVTHSAEAHVHNENCNH